MNSIMSLATRILIKFSLLVSLSCGISQCNNEYSIVFVHIGQTLPTYLPTAIEQARLFNEKADIVLIANKKAIEDQKNKFETTSIIYCEDLMPTKEHQYFIKNSPLSTSFRDGFWKKTTERLFYLEEFITQNNVSDVFHMEYDNMLYVDLGKLLPIFKKHYLGIAAIFDNETRCVPNFMYIPKPTSITKLIQFISSNARHGIDDMSIISRYREKNDNTTIEGLPVIPGEFTKYNSLQKKMRDPSLLWRNIALFDSIFDGAALGQYLGGIDPRNGPCTPGYINLDCAFNSGIFTYLWITDKKNRKIPYIEFHGKKYRINNLHIHSKDLAKFKS